MVSQTLPTLFNIFIKCLILFGYAFFHFLVPGFHGFFIQLKELSFLAHAKNKI